MTKINLASFTTVIKDMLVYVQNMLLLCIYMHSLYGKLIAVMQDYILKI